MDTNVCQPSSSPFADQTVEFGKVKWFGGLNNKTGRTNEYGFLEAGGSDLYFHKSDILSAPTAYTPDTEVVFVRTEGRKGAAAVSVQVLSLMTDSQLLELIQCSEPLAPEQLLRLIMRRTQISPLESVVIRAIETLQSLGVHGSLLASFWRKFAPKSPDAPLFPYAPYKLQAAAYQLKYADFRKQLLGLFDSLESVNTSLSPEAIYGNNLDEQDHEIALAWAGRGDNEALLAKMLSARAAEKAARRFYEDVGLQVVDTAITQLDGSSDDWKTHDLVVDDAIAVDVKNARRPVSASGIYSEHTVARFKLDRQEQNVRIAGVLSPYLRLKEIKEVGLIKAGTEPVVFLGETARNRIDQLQAKFGSASFEVLRPKSTLPSWLFSYPHSFYRNFYKDLASLLGSCKWPEQDEWKYIFDEDEVECVTSAFCVSGKPLPESLKAQLKPWQLTFFNKMQALAQGAVLDLPVIFFSVLTDFLAQLQQEEPGYSPEGYIPILFSKTKAVNPLGSIDPLKLVKTLIDNLQVVWDNRVQFHLGDLISFRFGWQGLLQGRSRNQIGWTPLITYCGGEVFKTDELGNTILDAQGKPMELNVKCGHYPLVIGKEKVCTVCKKLICSACGFCTERCQAEKHQALTEEWKDKAEQRKRELAEELLRPVALSSPPQWELPPLDAYEGFCR